MDKPKKISFGFSKTKKPELQFLKPKREEIKVELIECLEGKTIKIQDAIEEVKQPLVIPIATATKSIIERIKESREKVKEEVAEKPDSELSVDELAVRALLQEAQSRETGPVSTTGGSTLTIETTENEATKESTLDDYENVPISEYGMAMLRGMGWKEGSTLGRNPSKLVKTEVPELRPKGLGLGANKLVPKSDQVRDEHGKELQLVKGAFAKIIAGSHKGTYCKIEGLDDENCRVIVRTAIGNQVLSLNEFLLSPITKQQYDIGSKVINNSKYEEFKELSDRRLKNKQAVKVKQEKCSQSDDDERHAVKVKKECSDSSEDQRKKKKKSKHKSKPRDYPASPDSSHKHKKRKSKSKHKDSDSDREYRKKHKKRR